MKTNSVTDMQTDDFNGERNRRSFLKQSIGLGFFGFFPLGYSDIENSIYSTTSYLDFDQDTEKSLIGLYGPWLAQQRADPGDFSYRNDIFDDLTNWKQSVRPELKRWMAPPNIAEFTKPETVAQYYYDGLEINELKWKLPYGSETNAVLLKPKNTSGRLPAILGLHDHGGNKYFGLRKITRTGEYQHPLVKEHQMVYYGGRAWANEIAKRGYIVLVHDSFTFGSRRVRFSEMTPIPWGGFSTQGHSDIEPEKTENIEIYNSWAGAHESVMAKSLFSGGTTWPGMFLREDQIALDILSERTDVDPERIGCVGLSGGGLRTNYLAGVDSRIKCAVSVGCMTTWDDFMLWKSYTHTWMIYIPILPKYLAFSEILSLHMPLPALVLNNKEDPLFTLSEMKKATRILEENYLKAGISERISCKFYPGPHKFDLNMQGDAFDWLDQWLK